MFQEHYRPRNEIDLAIVVTNLYAEAFEERHVSPGCPRVDCPISWQDRGTGFDSGGLTLPVRWSFPSPADAQAVAMSVIAQKPDYEVLQIARIELVAKLKNNALFLQSRCGKEPFGQRGS